MVPPHGGRQDLLEEPPTAVNVTQRNLVVTISRRLDEEIDRLIERIPPELRRQLGQQLEAQRVAEAGGADRAH